MSRQLECGGPDAVLFRLAAGLLVGLAAAVAAADEPAVGKAILRAQLDAGEFAPALEAAQKLPTLEERDACLAQIAAAQSQSGARDASLTTAGEISNDRTRSDALSQIGAEPLGGQGGASMADFESLIDLITSTVQPTTWDEVGGPGTIKEFRSGVHVEPQGLLRPLMKEERGNRLAVLRLASAPKDSQENVRRPSQLRMVSLSRLEKAVQLRLAAGRPLTEAMQFLAGLVRIEYVFLYPDSGDIVLAGPAGDWTLGPEGRVVNAESGRAVVRLDDLVVVFRHMLRDPAAQFGCTINPRKENLARVQEFLQKSSRTAIPADGRRAWVERLRSVLGKQDIEVCGGLDARTHAARVMVEADYRMKLVGAGLEPGVPGVEPYLKLIQLGPGQTPPPMGVLRWWFTLNYEAITVAKDHRAFAIRGPGVKVLSENERLAASGQRIHTGQSDVLNQRWAASFTAHFEELAAKYPVYAELRNLFDLALTAALVRQEDLPAKAGWHLTCFGDSQAFPVELGPAPKEVDTVVNHRVVNQIHVLVFVSGGVCVEPAGLVAPSSLRPDTSGTLNYRHARAAPRISDAWWWD